MSKKREKKTIEKPPQQWVHASTEDLKNELFFQAEVNRHNAKSGLKEQFKQTAARVRELKKEIDRRTRLSKAPKPNSSNKETWLTDFVKNKLIKVVPNLIDLPIHHIDSFQTEEINEDLVSIALDRENIIVGVKTLNPVLESPQLLSLLISRNIYLCVYKDEKSSTLFAQMLQPLSYLLENKKENEIRIVDLAGQKRKENAIQTALELKETIEEIENTGMTSLRAIAEELTKRGIETPNHKSKWNPMTVKRIKDRIDQEKKPHNPS